MTYGTFTTIKQALEALNLREDVTITITNGVVSIEDFQDMLDAEYQRGYEQAQDDAYIAW